MQAPDTPLTNDPETLEMSGMAVAKQLGVNPTTFYERAKTYAFPRTASGKYLLGPTMRLYHQTTGVKFQGRPPTARPSDGDPRASAPVTDKIETELADAREKLRKRKLENDRLEGKLVDKAAVDRDNFAKGRLIRDTLLQQWVPQVAQRAAGELGGDARRLAAVLDRELRRLLARLARDTVATLGDETPRAQGAA